MSIHPCVFDQISRLGTCSFGTLDKGQLKGEPRKWLQTFAKAWEQKENFWNEFTREMGEPIWGDFSSVLPFGSTYLVFFKTTEKISTNRRINILNEFTNVTVYSKRSFIS